MQLKPRGGMWQVHFEDSEGVRQRKSTGVKVDPALPDKGKAQANLVALDRMRAVLEGQAPDDVRRALAKVNLNLSYALDRTYSERWSTLNSSKKHKCNVQLIKKTIGYWPLDSITYTRLRDYAEEMRVSGIKPATLNRRLAYIQTAMVESKKRGELSSVPEFPRFTENNIKERYLSHDEETMLLDYLRANTAPADHPMAWFRATVELLLDTGCRAGEIIFREEQLLRGTMLHLMHGTTKSKKARSIPLTERAKASAHEMLANPHHKVMLKLHQESRTLSTSWLSKRFRLVCDKLGLHDVSLHTLRHTCASRLVQHGVPLSVVRDWLGHSSIVVTERYAHLAPTALNVGVAALEAHATVSRDGLVPVTKSPAIDTLYGDKLH